MLWTHCDVHALGRDGAWKLVTGVPLGSVRYWFLRHETHETLDKERPADSAPCPPLAAPGRPRCRGLTPPALSARPPASKLSVARTVGACVREPRGWGTCRCVQRSVRWVLTLLPRGGRGWGGPQGHGARHPGSTVGTPASGSGRAFSSLPRCGLSSFTSI